MAELLQSAHTLADPHEAAVTVDCALRRMHELERKVKDLKGMMAIVLGSFMQASLALKAAEAIAPTLREEFKAIEAALGSSDSERTLRIDRVCGVGIVGTSTQSPLQVDTQSCTVQIWRMQEFAVGAAGGMGDSRRGGRKR